MSTLDRVLAAFGALFAIATIGGLIGLQEFTLARSEIVYLELAPVDPRSLVQGDFMALRYSLAESLDGLSAPGTAVVSLDERSVAHFVRVADEHPLAANEREVNFFARDSQNEVASRAYLFQEGTADLYSPAKYGIMALSPGGDLALVGLATDQLARLGPAPTRW